ncbi:Feline leukemia virus subgroup C receptor-related protein 2 [Sparganum proliferum]
MEDGDKSENRDEKIDPKFYEPVVYKKRWLMLLLFSSATLLNAFQWIHLSIIADNVVYFWNGSLPNDPDQKNLAVAWLAMVYMLSYIPLIFPATWLLDRYGLRVSVILGAVLNAIGAWLKCVSVQLSEPVGVNTTAALSAFPILMFAQTICAFCEVALLGIPAQLAVTWFGEKEVPLATAIGVFGWNSHRLRNVTQQAVDTFAAVKRGFQNLFYGGAVVITVDLLLIIIFYKEQPDQAPSRAQFARQQQRAMTTRFYSKGDIDGGRSENSLSISPSPHFCSSSLNNVSIITAFDPEDTGYKAALVGLLKNCSFGLLNICYGVNTAVYYASGTLLNVILLAHYPTEQVAIGWIGFTMVVAGVIGSIVAGVVLERTGQYRRVLIIFYVLSVLSFGFYVGSIYIGHISVIFFSIFLLGFFPAGCLPLGVEYAAEITYPVNEGVSSGILNMTAHLFGIFLTLVSTVLINRYNGFVSNLFMLVIMVVATMPTFFLKDDLKRQRAQQKATEQSEPDLSVDDVIRDGYFRNETHA